MTEDASNAVDRLIEAVRSSPTALPLREVAAVHNTGQDVRIDATDDRVIAVVQPRRHAGFDGLTPREQQVATVVAAGYTNQQVAVALTISLGTVKDHVHSILTKTGFETRSQLIAAWYGGLS
ncbi:MAG: LuxR C-terminal-related transcriptional regulator [Actinomycetota bacterium]